MSSRELLNDPEAVRRRIISTVFSKLNVQGHQETYVSHVKIWEDVPPEEGGKKPRYILLARASDGTGSIHKSKLNTNGSFSVGKTWRLADLQVIEVVNALAFNITLARTRTYRWQTEDENEQAMFVESMIRLFRSIRPGIPLQLKGVRDPDIANSASLSTIPLVPPQALQSGSFMRMERAPTPPNGAPLVPTTPRRSGYANGRSDIVSSRPSEPSFPPSAPAVPVPVPVPVSSVPPRTPRTVRRPQSPPTARTTSPDELAYAYTGTAPPERSTTPTRARPTTPSSQSHQSQVPSALRPRQGRRPSNASSMRSSAATTASQRIPSIALPVSPVSTSPLGPNVAPPLSYPVAPAPRRPNGAPGLPITTLDVPSISTSSLTATSPASAYDQTPEITLRNLSPSPSSRSRKLSTGPAAITETASGQPRRENARVSFYDPANQATLDRLLSGDLLIPLDKDDDEEGEGEVGEETAQATLTSVEEMLEGFEWANGDIFGGAGRGTTDQIEARLLDELMALEKANIHSFIETDDRVNVVLGFLEDAISELDSMDSIIASYKIHLNAVGDDIAFIQSQNRGLQVQTQNQRALLDELQELLQTVQVDREALLTLTQESLEKGIDRLEEAATQLYKALQAGRDRDMAMTMERLDEYRTYNAQFCKRLYDFLAIMCTAQSKLLLGDNNGISKPPRGRPSILDHKPLEQYLGRYGGLMLYLKEMDESVYGKLCAAYFSAASSLHLTQIKAFLGIVNGMIKKGVEEDNEGFAASTPTGTTGKAAAGVRRAGTIVRSPLDGRKDKKDVAEGDMRASDAFGLVLERIAPSVYSEEEFIADFLQINDAALTFADYMGLEHYFRRQAARSAGLSQATLKLVRGAMDLIFGFLPTELKTWLDTAIAKDQLQVIGMIVVLEKFLTDVEERGNTFLLGVLEKQHARLRGQFERRVGEHIKSIEALKITSKKRGGVAPFIKYFPSYVGRVETQLIGADPLEIRQVVDQSYDMIVQSMFDALQHMAKMEGEGEDKGQLNYHVILIENMHHFVAEMSQLDIGTVSGFLKRAEAIYDENLNAYVKLVIRRPFSKIIDFFEGVERLLKTTAPSEVSSNSHYSKSVLKKVVKEYNAKDIRKNVDGLFKRVEKHFDEASEKATSEEVGIPPGTVMVGVWKACEEELLRITELFSKRISQCYSSSGVTLEYSVADVGAAFKRHRIAA